MKMAITRVDIRNKNIINWLKKNFLHFKNYSVHAKDLIKTLIHLNQQYGTNNNNINNDLKVIILCLGETRLSVTY